MAESSWWEVSFDAQDHQAESIEASLTDLGAQAISYLEAQTNTKPVFELHPQTAPQLWPHSRCVALFSGEIPREDLIQHIDPCLKDLDYDIQRLEEKNWAKICQDQFPPLCFGQKLWICPSWHTLDVPDAVVLQLDPGVAFGTGTHPTTAMCLEWLAHQSLTDKTLVDFGCGSGILGCAAALLGAQQVWAVDHCPQALLSSQANIQKNKLKTSSIHLGSPDRLPSDLKADCIIANILAQPLVELSQRLVGLLPISGTLVLSGILESQVDLITQAYQPAIRFEAPLVSQEWVCLVGKKLS